jgi:hypothetical protein
MLTLGVITRSVEIPLALALLTEPAIATKPFDFAQDMLARDSDSMRTTFDTASYDLIWSGCAESGNDEQFRFDSYLSTALFMPQCTMLIEPIITHFSTILFSPWCSAP